MYPVKGDQGVEVGNSGNREDPHKMTSKVSTYPTRRKDILVVSSFSSLLYVRFGAPLFIPLHVVDEHGMKLLFMQ